MDRNIFIIDTSSLIWAMKTAYPIDLFEIFWKRMEKEISQGILISNRPVYDEIKIRDDELFLWSSNNKDFFKPIDQETASLMPEIMSKCPNLIDPTKKKMKLTHI